MNIPREPKERKLNKLAGFFDKYKAVLKAPEGSVIKEVREVVKDLLDIDIPKEKIRYVPSTRTLSLTVGGPLKSELLLNKSEILLHLKGRLGEKSAPKDII